RFLVVLGRPGDVLARDDNVRHVARVDRRHELTEREPVVAGLVFRGKVPNEHADDDEHHPEQQALQSRVQTEPPTPLSLKIITACAGFVTRNASSMACPATQTIRSVPSTTSGTRSRSARPTLRSTKKSCSFFHPPSPSGEN